LGRVPQIITSDGLYSDILF